MTWTVHSGWHGSKPHATWHILTDSKPHDAQSSQLGVLHAYDVNYLQTAEYLPLGQDLGRNKIFWNLVLMNSAQIDRGVKEPLIYKS